MRFKRTLFTLAFIFIFILNTVVFTSAITAEEKIQNNRQGLIAVSYRGDTENYPENSIEAILSAKEIGADMVSVGVQKTKDLLILAEDENIGNFCNSKSESISASYWDQDLENCYLYDNSGKLTECKVACLYDALTVAEDIILILDIDPEDKDTVYDAVQYYDATDRVFLRFRENSDDIVEWVNSKDKKPNVIGIYSGNIIWNAVSHIENLSKVSSIVHYESKNYFNVMYGSFVADRFSAEGKARALAPAYDRELCGQREDNASGWNELVEKGFSVIETNNIASLVKYIERSDELSASLKKLAEKAEKTELSVYSGVSADNLQKALQRAKSELQKGISSVGELESANSQLLLAMNRLNLSDGYESQKGALNITAGKVIAAVLVGAAILAGQIYVHKMQQEKRRKKR
ncbi:MAG: glycerophosphodiester phosphodiesterase family protein [Clostridia bacterium]|nr:glycerophosphodiester phosphodiesterase family protein [Clostridia bacterium]